MNTLLCFEGKIIKQITHEETSINCGKLNDLLCEHMNEKSCILLFMEQNIHIPALILCIKDSGHYFISLDVKMKNEDIENLIEETKVHFILSFLNKPKMLQDFYPIGNVEFGQETIILWKKNGHVPKKISLHSESDSILCIFPSSGTTGRRKLIRIRTDCIMQNVKSLSKIFCLNKEDVIYFGTPLTFDPSLIELLLAFETGASLLIVPEKTKLNPGSLFRTLFPRSAQYRKVTFLQMVPSLFTRWSEKQIRYIMNMSQLKILAFGGENFPHEILHFERSLKLYNLYGITEVSCWAMIHEIKEDNEVYLGNVLESTLVKICCNGEEIKDEGVGELYVGSNTRYCCVNDETQITKWRATGDIVKKTEKGIKYLGRKNNSIKRLGHQVSLDEIERKVCEKIVLSCKSVWVQDLSKLLLFISIPSIHTEDKIRILDKLRVTLLHVLSKEEFPDFIDIVSTFPTTSNGKIDRNSLIQIYNQSQANIADKDNCDIFLILLVKYLGISLTNFEGIKSYTFFELGGNSILYTLLTNDLRDILNCNLPSKFLALILEKNIEQCIHFLKDVELTKSTLKKKRKIENTDKEEKRTKLSKSVEVIWKYNLQGCVDASPLVFERNGNVFVAVGSFSNFFAVLNALTGEIIFLNQFPDSIGSKAVVSPCLNFLYFGCFDGNLFCINLENNSIEWSYKTGDSIKSTPEFCRNNEAVVFGSYDKHLHCINAKTGKNIWKTYIEESVVSTPLIHYCSNEIITTTLLGSLISVSEETGAIIWSIRFEYPIFGSPSMVNESYVVFSDVQGNIRTVDIELKKEICHFEIEGEVYSSVIVVDNYLIVSSHKGYLYKYRLKNDFSDRDSLKTLYLEEPISTTPCLIENFGKTLVCVFTIHGNMYLINFESMDIRDHWKCPEDVYSSPSMHNDKLYFGCRDDNLYCLNIIHSFSDDKNSDV